MDKIVPPLTTWILMRNGTWWPAQPAEGGTPGPDFEQAAPGLTRMTILGLGTELVVDGAEASSIIRLRSNTPEYDSLCTSQAIPVHLQDSFRRSMSALIDVVRAKENSGSPADPGAAAIDLPRTLKRSGVVSWDDYFMAVAFLSSQRSKDPSTQVGACIVNPDKRIVGIGYNGFPRGCSDDILPWAREADDPLDTKYPFVCHAEMNAILNKNSADVNNCKMYVALFPCNECAKMIIQSGIKEVVYMSDKHHATPSMRASRALLTMAKVSVRQFAPKKEVISIDFTSIK